MRVLQTIASTSEDFTHWNTHSRSAFSEGSIGDCSSLSMTASARWRSAFVDICGLAAIARPERSNKAHATLGTNFIEVPHTAATVYNGIRNSALNLTSAGILMARRRTETHIVPSSPGRH